MTVNIYTKAVKRDCGECAYVYGACLSSVSSEDVQEVEASDGQCYAEQNEFPLHGLGVGRRQHSPLLSKARTSVWNLPVKGGFRRKQIKICVAR